MTKITRTLLKAFSCITLLLILGYQTLSAQTCDGCPEITVESLNGIPNYPEIDLLNVCGNADTISLLIYNAGECPLTDVNLDVQLDEGLVYGNFVFMDPNSDGAGTVSLAGLSDPSNPTFTITEIGPGMSFIVDFGITANCDIDPTSQVDLNYDATISFSYDDINGSSPTCEEIKTEIGVYNSAVKVPVVNLRSVLPVSLVFENSGEMLCQTLTISQDGILSSLDHLNIEATGIDLTGNLNLNNINVNGVAVPMSMYNYDATSLMLDIALDDSFFTGNTGGDTDNSFDVNESLTVDLCFTADGCLDAPQIIDYDAFYGCDDQVCFSKSSKSGTIDFQPIFNATPITASSSLDQEGMFCGDQLIWSASIMSANSDPVDGLWQDLVLNWDACNGSITEVGDVQIGGVSVPFTVNAGGEVEVDLSANTAAIPGLVDIDGDGIINDLPGGNALAISSHYDVLCQSSNAICTSDSCIITQIEIIGKRNCGQNFQDFAPFDPEITWNYGEISFDTHADVDLYGDESLFVTENAVSGDCNTWAPFNNGFELDYTYGAENIGGCASGNIYAVVTYTGSLGTMDNDNDGTNTPSTDPPTEWADVRYADGSATYNGMDASGNTTWQYTTDPTTGDTTGLEVIIQMGDAGVADHTYFTNLEANGHCGGPDWLFADWKVYEECDNCATDCVVLRSCHSTLTRLNWDSGSCNCPSGCSYTTWVETVERSNYGYTDKTMTTKVDTSTIPAVDKARFIPGDTMYIKVSTRIDNITSFQNSFRGFNFHLYDWNFLTDGQIDINNAEFIDIYHEDGVTGASVPLRHPCLEDWYPPGADPLLTTPAEQDYMSVTFYNSDYRYIDPALTSCTQQIFDQISPNWPIDQVNIAGNHVLTGASNHVFGGIVDGGRDRTFNGTRYARWDYGAARDADGFFIAFRFGDDSDCVDTPTDGEACYQEFLDQYQFKQGDKITFDMKIPIAANGFNCYMQWPEDAGNGFGSVRPLNILKTNFTTYSRDPVLCNSINYGDCSTDRPINIKVPEPVQHSTEVIVNDCEVIVEHTIRLQDALPEVADGENPWYENEYRPMWGVEWLEPYFPTNLVFQGGVEWEDHLGNVTPVGDEWFDPDYGNLSCVSDGAGGECCVAADGSQPASFRLFDQAFLDGQDPCWGHQAYDEPLFQKHLDPFPLLTVGGTNDCFFKIRYSLNSLCPEEVDASGFGLTGQYGHMYIMDWISLGYQNANPAGQGRPPVYGGTNLPQSLWPTLYAGQATNNSYIFPIGPNPIDFPYHSGRKTVVDTSTVEDITDNSLDYPPLVCSVSPLLQVENLDGVEETTYEICANGPGATHENVVTTITVPSTVSLDGVLDGGTALTYTQVGTTATTTSYAVVLPDIASGQCITLTIQTELLFCPLGLDLPTDVCIETVSGCLDPLKAAELSADSGAGCSGTECCFEYATEEADLQTEWDPNPSGEYPLCGIIDLGIRIKNVKEAVLTNVDLDFWFPPGLDFVSGSWQACFPGDGTYTNCMTIPNPTAIAAEDLVFGENYSFDDMSVINTFIHDNGLPGINSSLDSNRLEIIFQAQTTCDEFVSGTGIYHQAHGSDPCGGTVESMFVQSDPIIIENANPVDFAQFLAFAEPLEANCGVETTVGLTFLNVATIGESNMSQACITLDAAAFNYTPGNLQWVSPASHVPTVTETVNGAITQVCFDVPDGIGPGQAFKINLDFTVPDNVACDAVDLGVMVNSEITDQSCDNQPENCSVFVLNSINPTVAISFLPPLSATQHKLFSACPAGDGTIDICYEVMLANTGIPYSGMIDMVLARDINGNAILDDAIIDTEIAMNSSAVTIASGDSVLVTGCFTISEELSCPVFLKIVQETNCVCNSLNFYYNEISPAIEEQLNDSYTLCPGTPFTLETCGDWTYEVSPPSSAIVSTNEANDELEITLRPGEGVDSPVVLSITSQTGSCSDYSFEVELYSLDGFEFNTFDTLDLCSNGCRKLRLDLPAEYEDNVSVLWSPSTYLDDPTSVNPTICNPDADITYTISLDFITDEGTCNYSAEYPIVVTDPSTETLFTDTDFCDPDALTFTAPAGYSSYTWYRINPDATETPVGFAAEYTVDLPGQYYVAYVDPFSTCAVLSNTFTIEPCCKSVAGVAFLDNNNNGCQAGTDEIGIEGMIASIFECDDTGNPVANALTSDTTDVAGAYAFGPDETGGGNICLDPDVTYTVTFSFPADGSLDNYAYSTGDPAADGACDGTDSADDSPNNDGTTGCYDPTDPDTGDDGDEHIDIGLYECQEIGGVVFVDANNDGCQSGADEVGLEGMEAGIFECDANGNLTGPPLAVVSTAADGSYAFGPDETGDGNICLDPAKMYTVSFAFPPDGSLQNYNISTGDPVASGCDGTDSADDSPNNDASTGCYDPSDPSTGDDGDEHIDLGLFPCQSLAGVVFEDSDNDGCQADAADGIPGVTVELYSCDGNGNFTLVSSTTTGADGSYAFGPEEGPDNVCLDPAIEYQTRITPPAGFENSTGAGSACPGDNDDSTFNNGVSDCYNPSDSDPQDGDTDQHIDFGIYECETLGGVVFLDDDNDGCQADAADGISGVTVELYSCDGNGNFSLVSSTTTGADGSYAFGPDEGPDNLCFEPGMTYQTRIVPPSGFSNSTGAGADCDGDNDDSTFNNGVSDCYHPADDDPQDSDTDEHIDFGLFPCEELGGVAFFDQNNDGCQAGAEETGIEGLEASIFECDAAGNPTGNALATVATAADGSYAFGPDETGDGNICLEPGTMYTVTFGFPADGSLDSYSYSSGDPAADGACAGTDSADDSDNNDGTTGCYDPSDPSTGDDGDDDIDIGLMLCEEIGGVAFIDANNDGCQSGAEELGVEGMEASIFECDANGNPTGVALATISTAADGSYAFGPDEAGDGNICLDANTTYTVIFSFPADGSLDNYNYSTGDVAIGSCGSIDDEDDSPNNDGTTGCYDPTDPPTGDDGDENIDIGIVPCEEISGVAFVDVNNDGCQSGPNEIGVQGMEASIFECDGLGNPTGPALATVSTAANGSYAFGPEETGDGNICLDPVTTYTVTFSFPADGSLDNYSYSTGDPAIGACGSSDDADDSATNDGTTGCYDPTDPSSGDDGDEDIDIGLVPCEEISGVAFIDANNDGCQSGPDETGVEGMEASIFECDPSGNPSGIALATVSTAADGSYAFGPDETGDGNICLDPNIMYTVSFSFPADGSLDNYNYSTGDSAVDGSCAGTDNSDDSANNDGTTGCYDPSDPPSGDDGDEHIDIGIFPCEEISGVAFIDANNDGCQGGFGEVGIGGMIASLFECNDNGIPEGNALTSDTTFIDGSYAFGPNETGGGNICLDPGTTYTVTFSFPTDGSLDDFNFSTGNPNVSGCDGVESSDDSAANDGTTGCYDPSDPPSGDDGDEHIDIGIVPCEEISGVVFTDINNDGCQSGPNETGIEGMEASIYECDASGNPTGNALSTVSTTADGSYAFGPDETGDGNICLVPGTMYTVTFSFPNDGSLDNYMYSTGDPATDGACDGTDSADDSPANDGTTGCYDPGDPFLGDDGDEDIDIGLVPCEEIGGVVFLDANNDGCHSGPSETGVEGMEASIFECDASGNPTGTALATVSSAADGSYAFGPEETGDGNICLDPNITYTVTFSFPADGSLDNYIYSTGDPALGACGSADDADDSPANDGTTGCYDPSDPPSGDDGDEDIDIGLVPCEEIGGVVFTDINNDGCQSGPDETGIEGMEASIFECDASGNATGTALATVSTAPDGSYAFGPEEIGDGNICLNANTMYTVTFSFPADGSLDNYNYSTGDPAAGACGSADDADDSPANDGTTGCYDPSDPSNGDDGDDDIDIGLVPCEEVSGVAFIDANNDGCQSGPDETGVSAMVASLFECDASGNPTGVALASVRTNNLGEYAFGPDEVGNGNICLDPQVMYTVTFSFPANGSLDNYTFSTGDPDADGGCDGTDSADDSANNDGTTGCYDPSDPSSGDDGDEHIDIGIVPCESMAGVVFNDANNNGCQDATELGVENVTVDLFQCNADGSTTLLSTSSTAADGSYEFGPDAGPNNLCLDPALDYQVVISDLPEGFSNSSGNADANSDGNIDCPTNDDDSPNNDGTSACYNPSNTDSDDSDADEHIDFGIFSCETIGGVVFNDDDNSGCQDASEDGAANMMIDLYLCNSDGSISFVGSTTTDANGAYSFGPNAGPDNLCLDPALNYQVQINNLPDGYIFSTGDADVNNDGFTDCPGNNDDSPNNDGTSVCYNPIGNDADEHIDFGVIFTAPLSTVFESFTIEVDQCEITALWEVNNAVNIKTFEVQLSRDGLEYVGVASLTNNRRNHFFKNTAQFDLIRIKAVLADGTIEYSAIKSIEGNCESELKYLVYPIPTRTQSINIDIESDKDDRFDIKVMDELAKIVYVAEWPVKAGQNKVTLYLPNLPSGMYFMNFNSVKGEDFKEKIIIIE